MVLEEATASQEPAAYSDTAPSSDVDPYYSNNTTEELEGRPSSYIRIQSPGNTEPIYINTKNLPRPIALLTEPDQSQALARAVTGSCEHAARLVQRPLRQEEVEAFAFHWASSMRIASYGSPVGVSLAMFWAYRQKDYRFPGWSPMKSGRFSPDRFGPLQGATARRAWSFARYNAYGFVGMLFGSVFFASYAMTLHATHRATDPRMKDLMDAMRQRAQGKMVEQQQREMEGKGQGETFEMARQRRVAQQQTQQSQRQQQQQRSRQASRKSADDDMSPTGGAFAEDFMNTGSDTGLMSDGQTQVQRYRAEHATSTYDMSEGASGNQNRSQGTAKASSSSSASASASSSKTQQQPQSSAPGVSAWERLRQNAMSGTSTPSSPSASTRSSTNRAPHQDQSQSGDSFSFSQSDEERQLARSEAQKQFDERIEREREGQDFNEQSPSNGGRRGRW